ncbi:MAG: hypothetical protein E5V96_13035 [Mesorhizobium sp.]|nr:MAG: hypothetical protein E5V96_13035 [Mesorhizobium sp.]
MNALSEAKEQGHRVALVRAAAGAVMGVIHGIPGVDLYDENGRIRLLVQSLFEHVYLDGYCRGQDDACCRCREETRK